MDQFFLGSTPCMEDCAQVGAEFFHQDEAIETYAYAGQLARQFGEKGLLFTSVTFDHEFGQYKEVAVQFSETSQEQYEHAIEIENNIPENWDLVAIKEIIAGLIRRNFSSSEVTTKFAWMENDVLDVEQGRRLVRLIKKARASEPITRTEILALQA